MGAVAPNATGFVHRGALFSIQYGAEWRKDVMTHKVRGVVWRGVLCCAVVGDGCGVVC